MQARAKQPGGTDSILAGLVQARPHWLSLGALLLVVTALHLFSLMRTPPPFVDEAWCASRAWGLIHTGQPFGSLDAGVLDLLPGRGTVYSWLGAWFQSLGIRLLGLSLLSVRLVSLAFGLLLLVAIYAIGSRLVSRGAALLSVFLTSLSVCFFQSSHLARQDMMVAALGFAAVALYVSDRGPGTSLWCILSGLAVGLAFEIHMGAAIYGPAIVGLYLLDYGWSTVRLKRFWGFIGGVCGGLAFFAALHVVRYFQTYVAVWRLGIGSTRTPPLVSGDPLAWLGSLYEAGLLTLWAGGLQGPLIAGALLALLRRRSASDRKLVVLFAALLLAFAALLRHKASYYAILIYPAASLLVAAFLDKLWQERGRAARQASRPAALVANLLLVFACGLVVAAAGHNLAQIWGNPMRDYRTTVDRIRQVVAPGSSVVAPQTYWFGLPDQAYFSWEALPLYQHQFPGSTLEDAFRALEPEYFIVDGYLERFIVTDRAALDVSDQYLAMLRADLESFLEKRAHLVAGHRTETFGDMRIYKIDWDHRGNNGAHFGSHTGLQS